VSLNKVLASIKNYRKFRLPMQTQHTKYRPSDIPVQNTKKEEEILKNGVLTVGN